MISCEDLGHDLQEALAHLHDPDYEPSDVLVTVTGCAPQGGALAVQSTIARMIAALEPPPGTPLTARTRRNYRLLHNRFVLKLTVEETAERMSMSASSVRRAQREAAHVLARHLWEQYRQRGDASAEQTPAAQTREAPTQVGPGDRSQVERDLAWLQMGAPGTVADVAETVHAAVRLEQIVATQHNVRLRVEPMDPHLRAGVHPSALRQILVMTIGYLIEHGAGDDIAIAARETPGQVTLTLAGTGAGTPDASGWEPVREMLTAQGGRLEVARDSSRLTVDITIPLAGDVTVLVVDDNPDMVYFYQRCAEGTHYRLVCRNQSQSVFEAVEACSPDVIVLDIMLPDIDGWDVLANLHNHPATSSIPILVCSVVRERNLAMALGAAGYLHKPVTHQEFIQALDWAVEQTALATPEGRAHSSPTG